MEQQLPSVFDEIQESYFLAPASAGKRFANFIIDLIAIQGVQYGMGYCLGFFIVILFGSIELDEFGITMLGYFISIISFVFYYTLFETLTKGKTLGKLITGTTAIREDGSSITIKDAMLRSLIRLIPFEAFSALSEYPWHDKWTQTIVAKDSDISELNKFRLKG